MYVYLIAINPHLGGGDTKAYVIVKPNFSRNLGLLCIIGFNISLPILRYEPITHI